ncbi:MT-A70-domain-containing protein [Coccomyxa subellipsoidea C-169]|uniref:mRNA m(6)A methyltransferase n=1 Tax=Coccomyxa subellipsoidea (strain C-169) TaxID=574566 RepID=I0YNB2_COCSC|nr:MT-A70-domain-containing protein [Coccomyxa subellipsoidea C-169]EIE19881.1 MT-A70-domain-containing protein [Coccomyxa subellipsoidea C-169]|eukprot:XP_005644425.1 MT-A70-domain-containing protein [Coccomyxa subellipsoidea C-169]
MEIDEAPSTSKAAALLEGTEASADKRWAELSEQALDEEIAAYRGGIEDVSKELEALGVIWQVPPHCIPIHANVMTYDWTTLITTTQFDVIMMDPPWQLATANPTRGVALGYSQLTDRDIEDLPVPQLQTDGFLFVWVINAKYKFTLDLFERWGYTLVDEIVWVKMTVNRRLAKSHGYYLQHAKEVCLVGKKGKDPQGLKGCVGSDVIYAERRGQSQKPEEIYQLIEELVPGGRYLEIFGRKNNLHNYWVTIGNEVTGTGLPKEDVAALKEHDRIPNAVYGRNQKS